MCSYYKGRFKFLERKKCRFYLSFVEFVCKFYIFKESKNCKGNFGGSI